MNEPYPENETEDEERRYLHHEPVPGYSRIFYIVTAIAVLYLAFIFFSSL